MATRKKGRNRKSSVSIFSSKVKCGDCGSWYGPKVWHSNDAYRKVIWQCNHKFDGQKCATPTLTEDEIKELFLWAANQVIDQKEQFIAIYKQVLSRSLDTMALESELSDLEAEINIAAELIDECIKENAHVAIDQAEYQKRYDGLVARFDKAKARHTEVTDLIAECTARRHQIETYLRAAEPGAADGVPGNRLAGDGGLHHRSQQKGYPGDLQGKAPAENKLLGQRIEKILTNVLHPTAVDGK